MSRVNVYLEASNNSGKSVQLGGRSGVTSLNATINTDNANGSDCNLRVRADVVGYGTTSAERKKHGDDRKTIFTVELPDGKFGDACAVHIVPNNYAIDMLEQFGLGLVRLKGMEEVLRGDEDKGKLTMAKAVQLADDMQKKATNLPNVMLPGDISLAEALAAVAVVRKMKK
jgi:hypothetical protein